MVWTHEKNGTGKIAKESYGMYPPGRRKRGRPPITRIEEIQTILRAVSYTHLDVYKRQVLSTADCICDSLSLIVRLSPQLIIIIIYYVD